MNESQSFSCVKWVSANLLAGCVALIGFASALPAQAAQDPCVSLNSLMANRGQVIQRIQAFKDKKPTAEEACGAFTQLSKLTTTSIVAVDRDGAWCRAPDGLADSLKAQLVQIDTGKTNACKAAAEQKKAGANSGPTQRAPLGGADDILGGPMKLPQGAL